ncbi:MAG: hypothetical protein ACRD26_24725 [Vicinamibacterales bacterium]
MPRTRLRGTRVATSIEGRLNHVTKALYLCIGTIAVVALLAGRGFWLSVIASPIRATSAEIIAQPFVAAGEAGGGPRVESDDPESQRLDLIGNEIEEALADYRIDRGGSVYERHSPETAIQRLGSPST